jgi:hypothetical protein
MGLLRRLTGQERKEAWRRLAEELEGRYVAGGLRRGDRVEVAHGDFTLTLDHYVVSTGKSTVVYTRMRAPFDNRSGFRFTIYRRGVFTGLGKLFGMQDIEVGGLEFDREWVVKSNDESRVRALLANHRIRELLDKQKEIHFSVKDDEGWFGTKFPDGVDELHFAVTGLISDRERLKALYDLFAETLDELCRIGIAADPPAGIELK